MTGGLAGALVVFLVVMAGLALARRFAGGVARVGAVLAVLLVTAVALSASGLVRTR